MIHYIRALIFGIFIWALAFGEVLFLVFVLGLSNGLATMIHLIFVALLTIFMVHLYYKDILIKRGFVSGLLLGVFFGIVSLTLDLVVSVPLFIKEYSLYFADASNWIMIGILVTFSAIVGKVKQPSL